MSVADEIQKLTQLRNSGALSEDEFQTAKARLLGGGSSAAAATVAATSAPAPTPRQPESKLLDPQANAKAAIRIVAIVGSLALGVWLFMALVGGRGPAAGAVSAMRGPEIVFDEDIVVGSGGSQMRGFTIPSARPVQVVVEGKRDTKKGFAVYVMARSEWDNFKEDRQFRHIPAFQGLTVQSMTKTDVLPAGSYAVVVRNSENFMNSMVVHAKVTVDP